MSKYVNMLLVFFVITTNAYSQKRNCNSRSFEILRSKITYTDSIITNGLAVYTDSIIEADIAITYNYGTVGDTLEGIVVYDSISVDYKIDYPITLTNNPPFKEAFFRDYCEFFHQIGFMDAKLYRQEVAKLSNEEKGYYLCSSDDKYVNYVFLSKKDAELHAKYKPITEDGNEGSIFFPRRRFDKFMEYVLRELDKGLIVSFGTKDKKTYVVKTFASAGEIFNNFKDAQAWAREQMRKGHVVTMNYDKKKKEFFVVIKN